METQSSLHFQQISATLSRECSKALNKWLEECVRDFCPEVLAFYNAGDVSMTSAYLAQNGFNYVILPDSRYEFRLYTTPLRRCCIDIQLTARSVKPTASEDAR